MFFPESPKFRRGVQLIALSLCAMAAFDIILFEDFGGQRHVFTGLRNYLYPRIDAMYGMKAEELKTVDRNKIFFPSVELKEKP